MKEQKMNTQREYMRKLAAENGTVRAGLLVAGDEVMVRLESADYEMTPGVVSHVSRDYGNVWVFFGDERISCSPDYPVKIVSLVK